MKSFPICRWTLIAAVLLVTLCGPVFAEGDGMVLRSGPVPAVPETTLGDSVVLRGTRPANPASIPPAVAATGAPPASLARRWVCPPGFDCSRDERQYDRSGYSREDAD